MGNNGLIRTEITFCRQLFAQISNIKYNRYSISGCEDQASILTYRRVAYSV
jgi:hypothetical protein